MDLLLEVLYTVERIGMDNTIGVLKTAGKKVYEGYSKEIEFILEKICLRYKVTKHSIIYGTGNHEDKRIATDVFFYMLRKHLKITNKAIGDLCNLHHSTVSIYTSRIKNLDSKNKIDKPQIELVSEIDKEISDYMKTMLTQKQ